MIEDVSIPVARPVKDSALEAVVGVLRAPELALTADKVHLWVGSTGQKFQVPEFQVPSERQAAWFTVFYLELGNLELLTVGVRAEAPPGAPTRGAAVTPRRVSRVRDDYESTLEQLGDELVRVVGVTEHRRTGRQLGL